MNIEKIVLEYINSIKKREPIFISDFTKFDRDAKLIKEILTKLQNDFVIKKYNENIYYRTEKTQFGELGIDKEKLIRRLYLQDSNEIFGYITGPKVWNYYGLTTQISNRRWIATNMVKQEYENNDLRVRLIVPRIIINNENYKVLQILDVIEDKNRLYIQDLNYKKYCDFLVSIAKNTNSNTIKNIYELSGLYDDRVQDDVNIILNSKI